jgi:hypothetical protein
MRPKVVLTVIGLALLVVIAVVALRKPAPSSSGESVADNASVEKVAPIPPVHPKRDKAAETNAILEKEMATILAAGVENVDAMTPQEKHQAYVEARVQELLDLGMEEDNDSLNIILSELTSPDEEIRKAAVEAAIQFGSRDAIPALTVAGQQLDDPEEKAAIKEAIEFLKLPKFGETNAAPGTAQNQVGK